MSSNTGKDYFFVFMTIIFLLGASLVVLNKKKIIKFLNSTIRDVKEKPSQKENNNNNNQNKKKDVLPDPSLTDNDNKSQKKKEEQHPKNNDHEHQKDSFKEEYYEYLNKKYGGYKYKYNNDKDNDGIKENDYKKDDVYSSEKENSSWFFYIFRSFFSLLFSLIKGIIYLIFWILSNIIKLVIYSVVGKILSVIVTTIFVIFMIMFVIKKVCPIANRVAYNAVSASLNNFDCIKIECLKSLLQKFLSFILSYDEQNNIAAEGENNNTNNNNAENMNVFNVVETIYRFFSNINIRS